MSKFNLFVFLLLCCSTTFATNADDWPQWRGPDRDGTWDETGLTSGFADATLPTLWETKIGSGYSGPTVADGRVYVTDRVRSPKQIERVLCFNAETGKEIWQRAYDCIYKIGYEAGPRASVTVDGELAYAMGAMGHLHCLNAASGEVVWQHDIDGEYELTASKRMPIWGQTCSPLIFGELVIVQTGARNASVIAFDKTSGQEIWKALNDPGQYSSPVLVKQANKDVLICWTGASVTGLNPADGQTYWRHDFPVRNMPIGCASPVVSGDRVFFTSFYDGSLMLQLAADETSVRQIWKDVGPNEKKTRALQSIISTPIIIGDYIYGVDSYGELRCLNAATGERIWEDLSAVPKARWSTIHFVKAENDRIWMFNERGELLIGKLAPEGFTEIDRAKLIEPTTDQLRQREGVCWSHPAFAMKSIFARNDNKLVRADLSAK